MGGCEGGGGFNATLKGTGGGFKGCREPAHLGEEKSWAREEWLVGGGGEVTQEEGLNETPCLQTEAGGRGLPSSRQPHQDEVVGKAPRSQKVLPPRRSTLHGGWRAGASEELGRRAPPLWLVGGAG